MAQAAEWLFRSKFDLNLQEKVICLVKRKSSNGYTVQRVHAGAMHLVLAINNQFCLDDCKSGSRGATIGKPDKPLGLPMDLALDPWLTIV
jgi:hypothetical protein